MRIARRQFRDQLIAAPLKPDHALAERCPRIAQFRDQLIAAPLKRELRFASSDRRSQFRDQLIAAPLKPLAQSAASRWYRSSIPRSADRGPIEASHGSARTHAPTCNSAIS